MNRNAATAELPGTGGVQTSRLFVYGTLKRGLSRAHALKGQCYCGQARTLSEYRMFDCGSYPGLVESPNDGVCVEGEVWDVDAECLAELDNIEGISLNLYRRRVVKLQPPFDEREVQTYFYQRDVTGLRDCGTTWPPQVDGPFAGGQSTASGGRQSPDASRRPASQSGD